MKIRTGSFLLSSLGRNEDTIQRVKSLNGRFLTPKEASTLINSLLTGQPNGPSNVEDGDKLLKNNVFHTLTSGGDPKDITSVHVSWSDDRSVWVRDNTTPSDNWLPESHDLFAEIRIFFVQL